MALIRFEVGYCSHQEDIYNTSKIIVDKKYVAASELMAFYEEIVPLAQEVGDIYDEVYKYICASAENIELWIKSFVQNHGVLLSEDVWQNLRMARFCAGDSKCSVKSGKIDEILQDGKAVYEWLGIAVILMNEDVLKPVSEPSI